MGREPGETLTVVREATGVRVDPDCTQAAPR